MAIRITEEIELSEFKAWSGGLDRLNSIIELDIVDEVQAEIEAMLEGKEEVTETDINDILWFEMDGFISQYETEEAEN